MTIPFEQARDFFLAGVRDYEAGRYEPAARAFEAALALVPGRPSALTNLGAVRLKLGQPQAALEVLEEAVQLEPDNAEALGHCGTALAELGQLERAEALFARSLAIAPAQPAVWTLRGSALKDLGRPDEARNAFGQALANGGDPELNRWYLAGLGAEPAPPAPPAAYVEALFDGYAGQFDEHLTAALRYDAPAVLARRIADSGRRFGRALDLGCGTGLCGPLLKPLAGAVDGVDLSAAMLERAAARGAYDGLVQGDVVAFLQAAEPGAYDLLVAADVFIYVGALEPVFAAAAACLAKGGLFCFSLEESNGPELELRPSLRYGHSEAYARRLAEASGFGVNAIERGTLREDQRQAVPGLFVWLERR